jgi:hypothetical protein
LHASGYKKGLQTKRGEAEIETIRKEEFVCKQAIKEPEKYPEKEANRYSNQIPAPGVQG